MRTRNKYKTRTAALLAVTCLVPTITRAAQPSGFSYQPYADVLSTYVNGKGLVEYEKLKENRAPLDTFVDALAGLDPATFAEWDRNERFVLWMNAYNALTLRAVIDHYPVESIRDIGGLVRSVWDKLKFNVMGRTLTLNQIEHDILRKEFADARLHMAINCASIGCPPLGKEPLQADRLEQQFDELTRRFLSGQANFRIRRKTNTVYLSSIFKWFGKDFVSVYAAETKRKGFNDTENAVLNFVARYVDEADRDDLNRGQFEISYRDYDWRLNKQ